MLHLDLRPLTDATLAVVAVVFAFLWIIAIAAGLFGLPLMVLLFFAGTRYGYAVIRSVAQGRRSVPPPDLESMNPVGSFQTVLHSGFFGGALFVLVFGAPVGGVGVDVVRYALALALGCIYPASAALLALSGDLGSAMNPRRVTSLIKTLGQHYALLLAAWCVLAFVSTIVPRLPWPSFLGAPLTFALGIWTGLAFYALIGSLMRSHRHLLDIPGEIESPEEIRERDRRAAWQGFLDRAYASIRSGFAAQGYRTITELVDSEGGSLLVQQWVFERMLTWEDRMHALAFATRLVETLLSHHHDYDALEVVTRCKRISASYTPGGAAAARLAAFARSIGRDGIADELMESANGPIERAPL